MIHKLVQITFLITLTLFFSCEKDDEILGSDTENMNDELCVDDPNFDERRYCEILLGFQQGNQLISEVWGTQGHSLCPDDCWEALNADSIQAQTGALFVNFNGPRIWLAGGEATSLPSVDEQKFGDMTLSLKASLIINPSTIGMGGNENYTESTVVRNTIYNYPAGTFVYELKSPDGSIYTMQSLSLIVDSDLSIADLETLESRLQLPDGWEYEARILSEDLILVADGQAIVLTDDLLNTYQRRISPTQENQIDYEIIQVLSADELIVWLANDITQAEFESLSLPQGWFKNLPREAEADGGAFLQSPNATSNGEFLVETHFNHSWREVAVIEGAEIEMDNDGLLTARLINKYHQIGFNEGQEISILISPLDDHYVRISRDANRTQENPTIPSDWELIEVTTLEELLFMLPNPTYNIHTDNEDSFQGPVPAAELGL